MSSIEEVVFSLLSASASVTAFAPASKILPPGDWQTVDPNYIVHFPVTVTPIEVHQGTVPLKMRRYQVSHFARDYKTAKQMADATNTVLRAQFDPRFFWVNRIPMPYEADVKLQQIIDEYDVWEAL